MNRLFSILSLMMLVCATSVLAFGWSYQEFANATLEADHYYFNYTIPEFATNNSLWQIKYYDSTSGITHFENLSVSACMDDQDILQLKIDFPNSNDLQCYDISTDSWITLTTMTGGNNPSGGPYGGFYLFNDGNWDSGGCFVPDPGRGIFVSCVGGVYNRFYEEAMWWDLQCESDWNCTLFAYCNSSDQMRCIEVEDLNGCGTNYTGNYTEFGTESCDYCTPSWNCTDYSGYCNQIIHRKDCMEITDLNNCYPQTNLSSDYFDGNFTPYAADCGYRSQYNTTDVKNQAVDAIGGGAMEFMYWVRILIVVFTLGFIVYGLSKLGIDKLKSIGHK